jgi:hypothetical protein
MVIGGNWNDLWRPLLTECVEMAAERPREEQYMGEPSVELLRLINGFWLSQAIHVAASLGIADFLEDGARGSDELVQATGTHPRTLYRLMRALAAAGIFEEQADRRFALAPMGNYLRSDVANSRRAWAQVIGRPYVRQCWGQLAHTVKTGETAFRSLYGTDVWTWRSTHSDEGALFDAAMTALSQSAAPAIIEAYDFSSRTHVVDVGGGQGALLTAILARHPRLEGVLYDLPQIVAGATPILEAAGVADRCTTVGGNAFENVPSGGDAYLIKSVLMDEDDARAIEILASCRRVMAPQAKVLVIERGLGAANEAPEAKFSDLTMMLFTGGRERSTEEFHALFAASGLQLEQVIPTRSPFSIFVGAAA